MDQEIRLTVEEGGVRLDRFISDQLPQISRATAQRLIGEGSVLVRAQRRKPSYRLLAGDLISIHIAEPKSAEVVAEKIPLDILYEDSDIMVVNKPAGMVVHPAAGHSGGTLVNAVLAHARDLNIGGEIRPGIVHRLDAGTSGLILVAKSDIALTALQTQFKSRQVHKTYLALLEGQISPARGRIEAPIGRDPKHRQKMTVTNLGRSRDAVTVYETLATPNGYSLVQAEPQTGRTHQIRVHFAFMHHPVVADSVYGRKKNLLGLERQFLHAWKIEVELHGVRHRFSAPLADDLARGLQVVGLDSRALE